MAKIFSLILVAVAVNCCAALPGLEILSIDEVLQTDGIFKGKKLTVPSLGVLSDVVSKFSTVLNLPGVLDSAYNNYAAKFGKNSDEERKDIFKGTVLEVFTHNLMAKKGKETFTMGLNQFSDMTLDEVREKHTGAIVPNDTQIVSNASPNLPLTRFNNQRSQRAAPDSRDWRQYGIVTPPKNQGSCGSCTLFALTGALESAMALYKNSKNLDLSEQELLDCATGNGIAKCQGNWPEDVYEYQKSQGQTTEDKYPYEGSDKSCRASGKAKQGKVTNYFKVTSGDEAMMKDYIGNYGAVSVIVEINDGFRNYKSGVMSQPCSNTKYDHSILAVGYGNENGQDYWIVKNSWGTGWGDGGYIKMARNKQSLCRIADYSILPQA